MKKTNTLILLLLCFMMLFTMLTGDVIKGAFCGHAHYDMNTKIVTKNPDGSPAEIPQYVIAATGSSYKKGHIL